MPFRFDVDKTVQAAGVLLQHEGGAMTRLRLLKLLYLADRGCIEKTGRPITGDNAVAMDHGPVLSQTYDLVKGQHIEAHSWAIYFESSHPLVRLLAPTRTDSLSRFEIALLQGTSDRHTDMDDWTLSIATHQLREYIKNEPSSGSSRPIPFSDILAAVGRGDAEQAVEADAAAEAAFDRVFGESAHERR